MHAKLQESVAFHLTGKRAGDELGQVAETGLRPALLAGYRDLTRLRYDFPLVLSRDAPDELLVEALSRLVDRALERIGAPGNDGERLRAHAHRLERELRAMAAAGVSGPFGAMLENAAGRLAGAADATFADSLARLRAALALEGELVDCGKDTPVRVLLHLWRAAQRRKAETFHRQVDRLILKLGEILRADEARSAAARSPKGLQASFGSLHEDAFDYEAMSRLLARAPAGGTLSESRRRRIEATRAALSSQRFYPAPDGKPLVFRFDDCASALAAFRQRVPQMASLARAITVAQLEIDGEYSEPRHDAMFERLAESSLDLRDMAMFPDYLVCLNARDLRAAQNGELMEILASGLPMKILVQSDDLLEEPLVEAGHVAFGARSRQLAQLALGLNGVFVLQASASHLLRCRERILRAMAYQGPCLFSVFSGATPEAGTLPPYLHAAAAMESRAFPAFAHDPSAGNDWASRFSLEDNPQPESDWPVHELRYENAEHEGVSEKIAFTLADFVACDRRHAAHFAMVPRSAWDGTLAPLAECLEGAGRGLPQILPSLPMVDADDRLERVIVDDRLVRETRRCREMWRSLQELGGIRNSHVTRALARQAMSQAAAPAPEAAAPTAPAAAPPPPAEPEKERNTDEPYIETARCSSCNECTQINDKMFAYDENKQARIVDANAGTYRQLVEAAESCQVAVIHPGKPKNPAEPGLEELLKRAEPFL